MSDEERLLESLITYLIDDQKHTIRIYGHGASGKSTFARKLQLSLGEERANLLATDPYVIAGDYRDLLSSKDFPHQKVTACLPAVHELSSLERDICVLQTGLWSGHSDHWHILVTQFAFISAKANFNSRRYVGCLSAKESV